MKEPSAYPLRHTYNAAVKSYHGHKSNSLAKFGQLPGCGRNTNLKPLLTSRGLDLRPKQTPSSQMSPSESEFVLHIWPGKWDLPTFDPQCLAAVIYLQNSAPTQFRIAESTNPDLSPTGMHSSNSPGVN